MMLTLDEACAVALELAPPVRTERVPLAQAWGRVLAAPVSARISVPPFARALMDGFAVRAVDTEPGAELPVIATVYAGDDTAAVPVRAGTAVRIMTGAPLPPGADAVIRLEWTEDITRDTVRVLRRVVPGESIQPAGEDARAGDTLLTPGVRLEGPQLAVCRTFGVDELVVARPPVVAILVTGNELVPDPARPLQPGQIYATNDLLLEGGLRAEGITTTALEFLPDDEEIIVRRLAHYAPQADIILTTGGVSAGERDHIRHALARLGADIRAERVWMRPGTPVILARLGETAVFGLSGNPAACLIQFEVLVVPALRKSLGQHDPGFSTQGILAHDLKLKHARHVRILRGNAQAVQGRIHVDARFAQSSAVVSSLGLANCLIRIDGSQASSGSIVPIRWLSHCRSGG